MTTWYYADAAKQRQGPLAATELAQLFHQGRLRLDTLVWRDGLPQWQPLRDFSDELALHQAPAETFYTPVEPATVSTPAAGTAPVFSTGIAQDSPYAPPAAALTSDEAVVHAGGEVVYSGLWKRLAASFLDGFVTAVLTYAVLIPMMLLMGLSASQLASNETSPFAGGMSIAMALLIYPISFGIPAIYFAWMHASSRQASLGKMAVDAKVVRSDGSRIGFWRGILRYLAYFLFALVTCGLGVLISGLMVAFTERKQALHDMLCDTLVVDKWAFTAHPEWQKRELGTVTVVILALFGILILGTIAFMAVVIGMSASAAG
ncbi:MAG TPA: RDD family protein [Pseudoxanthomonas sp.]